MGCNQGVSTVERSPGKEVGAVGWSPGGQGVEAVGWNPGGQYQMDGVKLCYSLTVTAAGEVVVWVLTESDKFEAQWYNKQGNLIHTASCPSQREHKNIRVLAVEVGGKQQIALSCWECQCIWLGSRDTEKWSVAWKPSGEEGSEERKGQPKPYTMCQGKPGQIIARNWQGESASIFDITQIPFRVVVEELKLWMYAQHLCRCDVPGVGGALTVSDGRYESKLNMYSGKLLWSIGGEDKTGQRVKVAGALWVPRGVCGDNRGRLYVADEKEGNNRIIVLSAASGSVLQVVQGKGHWEVLKQREGSVREWVSDVGVTVYGADIKYEDDEPSQGVESGTVLKEFKLERLGRPIHLYWHEQSKSIVIHYITGAYPNYKHHITNVQIKEPVESSC